MKFYYSFYYGIKKQESGDITSFARKKKVKNAIIIAKGKFLSREEALIIAESIRYKYIQEERFKLKSGDIVMYADKYGQHTAIVINPGEYKTVFIFITSNPLWSNLSRKMSKDELALLGYPDRGKVSYFVPVSRYNEFAVSLGRSFPSHRVVKLKEEFELKE